MQPGSKLPGQKREQAPALHTHKKNSPIAIHHYPSFMTQALAGCQRKVEMSGMGELSPFPSAPLVPASVLERLAGFEHWA